MRVAFACPSYGPIDARVAHWQRHAIMNAWNNGIEVHADIYIDRHGWDAARNAVVEQYLQAADACDLDGVLWCDADTILPGDTFYQLCAPGVDVCTGIYYGRRPPYEPQIFIFNEDADAWTRILDWPKDALFPVHGHGFGVVYTSRKALELTLQTDFEAPPALRVDDGAIIPIERKWWFRTRKWGEDLTWCHYARKQGLVLWCNPRIEAGHVGDPEVVERMHFEKYYEEHQDTLSHRASMRLLRGVDGEYSVALEYGARSFSSPTLGRVPEGEQKGTDHELSLGEQLRMTPSA